MTHPTDADVEAMALLPCPFCGGAAIRKDIDATVETDAAGASYICCKRCWATTALQFDRKENLEDSWNRRTYLRAVEEREGLIEALAVLSHWVAELQAWHAKVSNDGWDDYLNGAERDDGEDGWVDLDAIMHKITAAGEHARAILSRAQAP